MPSVDVTAPSGSQSTRRPAISASFDFAHTGLWRVYVFRASAATIAPSSGGAFDINNPSQPFNDGLTDHGTAGVVYQFPTSGWGSFAFAGHTPPVDLPLGDLFAIVAARTADASAWYWGAGALFGFQDTLGVPTLVAPANGATLDTNLPLLQAVLAASTYGGAQFAEWQLATDAGFTANVKTVTEPASEARTSGPTSEPVPASQALFASADWRARVRAKNASGNTSSWSSAHAFTVAHLPTATLVAPPNGSHLEWGAGQFVVAWAFSSTSPDMAQTAYQVVVEEVATDDPVDDTGQTTSTATSVAVTGLDSGLKGVQLRAKVRVWDSEDVVGPYSTLAVFTLHDPPAVDVTAPSGTIDSPAPLVEWDYTASSGGAQDRYRVQIVGADGPVYDSGWQLGAATSWQVPVASGVENLTSYTALVSVRDVLGVNASDSLAFDTEWVAPDGAAFTVEASTYDTAGPVTVLIDTSTADEEFAGWVVQRCATGTTAWADVFTSLALDPYVRVADYHAPANLAVEYRVVQFANRFGVLIPTADADVNVHGITAQGQHFWLIGDEARDVGDTTPPPVGLLAATNSIRLAIVVADQYRRDHERVEYPLAGRGRKVEFGTDFGLVGSLDVTLAGSDALVQQATIEALLTQGVYLRKPSARVAWVNVHDVAFSPQGRDDLIEVTVPYVELTV